MRRDIREAALYREAEAIFRAFLRPGTGQIADAAEIHAAPNGKEAVFTGVIFDALEGTPPTRICHVDLTDGRVRVLTFGPNTDRSPKYSPDGAHIAFLSDRHGAGDFRLYLLDPVSGAARRTPSVDGWVEYLHWSPDGRRILLGVAGHGADVAGGQGAITSKRIAEPVPSWAPLIEVGNESHLWRRLWTYELATDSVKQVSPNDLNIWEAAWCGNEAVTVVASPEPGEALWYSAKLYRLELNTGGRATQLYSPRDQLGLPTASPSGEYVAVVDAVCSDRWIVAGDLQLVESTSGVISQIDTHGVEVTCTEWRSERHLLVGGHRGFESVLGICDVKSRTFTEVWVSREFTTVGFYFTVSGLNQSGDCVLVGEGFARAPEIAVVRRGEYRPLRSFDPGAGEERACLDAAQAVSWQAPDGLVIQGWLLKPKTKGPFPLIMNVHGGPVWHWRPSWIGRRGVQLLMLIKRGYAVFFPNPRGSSGRGRSFAKHVMGDSGGADTYDYLSGLDYLVEQGIADKNRIGVTGGSYGGFMTSWLVTQDTRFAAAVPIALLSNWLSTHLVSNISHFVALSLDDKYTNLGGKYYQRSPVIHAHKARTPTLSICGALDRCTPPHEAMQFHNALLENGVKSALLTYPEEGHGIRKLPAAIDCAARTVAWFERFMRSDNEGGGIVS